MNASERTAGAEPSGSKRARASRRKGASAKNDANATHSANATNDASEIRADVAGDAATDPSTSSSGSDASDDNAAVAGDPGSAATVDHDALDDEDASVRELPVRDEDSLASDAESLASDEDAIVHEQDPAQDPSDDAGEPPAADSAAFSAGNELSDDELLQAVSALVFASPEPLSERRLIALLDGPEPARVTAALDTLKTRLIESRLPFVLVAIAGGWQIVTVQEMAETVQRLFKTRKAERVSPAALETLAVVAYRQPVTKADIEAIRGVQVGPILRTLVDRGFIRVTGRAEVPGHPLQYGTTRQFLERFGLSAIEDLPRDSELAKG
jgi:segregation and condensation protein B